MRQRRNNQQITKKKNAKFAAEEGPRPQRIRHMGLLMPDAVEQVVTFTQTFLLLNTTNYYWTYPLYTNAPYDVDPSLGSTSTQGHAEASAYYNKCRVISYHSQVSFASATTYPVVAIVLHRNTNLSTAGGSASDATPYLGNPLTQHRLITGFSGESRCVLSATHSIQDVVGATAVTTADNFASSVTSIPADLTFLEIGVKTVSPVGSYLTTGVAVLVNLRMTTLYYERKQLST